MSDRNNKYSIFEYHLEDLGCESCLYYDKVKKNKYYGCDRFVCCCEDIRADAINSGRVLRDRGWNRH